MFSRKWVVPIGESVLIAVQPPACLGSIPETVSVCPTAVLLLEERDDSRNTSTDPGTTLVFPVTVILGSPRAMPLSDLTVATAAVCVSWLKRCGDADVTALCPARFDHDDIRPLNREDLPCSVFSAAPNFVRHTNGANPTLAIAT